MSKPETRARVKLVFADRGSFHELQVSVPESLLRRHERIIDALRAEPAITADLYVDLRRLVAAHVLENGAGA